MTFNIHHGAGMNGKLDLERVARAIEASGAAVVGLQEVDRFFDARSNWVDQPSWLAARLKMNYVFAANLDWDPAEPGKPRRQYGTLVLSKYPIVDSRNTLLPLHAGSEQRGLLEALIDVNGTPLRFANTHLTTINDGERLEQVNAIVALLKDAPEATLLVGDLNAVPTSTEVRTLTTHLTDTWKEKGFAFGFTNPVPVAIKRIDYQLHNSQLVATAASVPLTFASDHWPLVATYSLT
ncbi:endonuclease/exonuclease/phosphatase family protein [Kribbella sp.]|uniref:endonuclease/exonuclease/phosphatase family protein n=1 Tax=Kribbella sp. TaxID=1871183 RepID=UPI002D6E2043|nr:endonuclease/exonuclease/phosphatase family protein [Kribbella sp.]HZX08176.1 endonuclease/exonuclease/phosphatase family protein [Kribbella sp.]